MGRFYTVKKGDYLAKIAHAHGIHDWMDLYMHPANDSFRELRPDPNVIAPGDQLYIPSFRKREHPRETDSRHTFELVTDPPGLHVVLKDSSAEVMANQPCQLVLGSETINTSTDGNGALKHDALPPGLDKATIIIGKQTIALRIGHLDPCEQLSGAQGRLRNLGYYLGPCHGQLDDPTRAAIRAFKVDHDLGDNAELTVEVTERIRQEYGF